MRPILISTAALALAELLGTYTTTLKRSDIPDPAPPELDRQYRWTLRITKDGGPDDKPALTIVKPPDDVLESSLMRRALEVVWLNLEA